MKLIAELIPQHTTDCRGHAKIVVHEFNDFGTRTYRVRKMDAARGVVLKEVAIETNLAVAILKAGDALYDLIIGA